MTAKKTIEKAAKNTTSKNTAKTTDKPVDIKKIDKPVSKIEGTIRATMDDYNIVTTDNGHIVVNTKTDKKSEKTSSLRVAYHVARQARKNGDDELGKLAEASEHIKSAQGSGKKRNPVASLDNEITKLLARKNRLADSLKEVESKLKQAQADQATAKVDQDKVNQERRKELEKELADMENSDETETPEKSSK